MRSKRAVGAAPVALHYRRYGNAQELLILIPGLAADHSCWRLMIPRLAAEYTVVAVDNRGAGRTSDAGRFFSIEDMADDIVALAGTLGVHRFLLAGHSMGGAIAQSVAYRYPERVEALALCNTFVRFDAEAGRFADQIIDLYRSGANRGEIVAAMLPRVFSASFLTPQLLTLMRSSHSNGAPPQSEHDYRRQVAALRNFDSSPWIGSLCVPGVVIDSTQDLLARRKDADRLAQLIRGAARVTLAGGHSSPLEQPAALSQVLLSFFRARSETSRAVLGLRESDQIEAQLA